MISMYLFRFAGFGFFCFLLEIRRDDLFELRYFLLHLCFWVLCLFEILIACFKIICVIEGSVVVEEKAHMASCVF
jgi:hypothetical protein